MIYGGYLNKTGYETNLIIIETSTELAIYFFNNFTNIPDAFDNYYKNQMHHQNNRTKMIEKNNNIYCRISRGEEKDPQEVYDDLYKK